MSNAAKIGSRLPPWKKVCFSLVTTVLFFAALEAVLVVAGVRTLLYDDDPHVGFASNIPLFVEGRDGQMTTAPNKVRWFNEQQFTRQKPEGVTRVFCVGGSTTYGRPYADATSFCGWLREYLTVADPTEDWEVINAGGISYASYRVAKVMEELIDYEPDLFVIYSGHNEFLEERTYAGIINTPSAIRGMQSLLGHTRTYSLMSRLLRPGPPQPVRSEATPVLAEEVNTILDQSAGLDRYKHDPELKRKIMAHYRFNLSRMVDIAHTGGAKVIFVSPAANLGESSPFKSENSDDLTDGQLAKLRSHMKKAEGYLAKEQHEPALAELERALSIDDGHADIHYLAARGQRALGQIEAARNSYTAALEKDVCPLRILPEMRLILAETAAGRDVPLVDFHAFLSERSEHGIPGNNWFLDHVHPTIEGHRLLALELVTTLENEGMLTSESALTADSIQQVKDRVLAGIDDEARGIALRNLGNVLNWAGKKREAYNAASKALELAPGDAYANYLAGDLARFLGKTKEAEARFRELTKFNLNPEDAPYFADAHYQLARILGERGETGESVNLLLKTIKLQPDHSGAAEILPVLLQSHGKKLLQSGRNTEAVAVFRKLEKFSPANGVAANLLGAALIQQKNYGEAIEVLNRAVTQNGRNHSARNNLGTAFARSGRALEAVRQFELAIQLKPDHSGAHLNLARLLESMGNRKKAEAHYRSVIQANPTSAEAKAGLSRLASQTK